MLTPEEYASVSDTPYDEPLFPDPLVFARNTEPAVVAQQQADYFEAIRVFREATDVKKIFINQIVASVDSMYLRELRDGTNNISRSIPDILEYLYDNFADVTAEDVNKEEAALNQLHWNVVDPPMVFFTAVEDFQKLATAAGLTRTESMLIAIGENIIRRTGDFENALMEWWDIPEDQQT